MVTKIKGRLVTSKLFQEWRMVFVWRAIVMRRWSPADYKDALRQQIAYAIEGRKWSRVRILAQVREANLKRRGGRRDGSRVGKHAIPLPTGGVDEGLHGTD